MKKKNNKILTTDSILTGTAKPDVNTAWANSGALIEPDNSKYNLGWTSGEKPFYQYMNFVQNRADTFIKHVNEYGIAQWDGVTIYSQYSIVLFTDGNIYQSLADSNQNNQPDESPTFWKLLSEEFSQSIGDQNRIINSGFPFWQRVNPAGTALGTNAIGYACDRWIASTGLGGGQATVLRGTFAAGTTLENSDDPIYYYQHQQTAASTTGYPPGLTTRLEDVRTYAGKKITVSFGGMVSAGSTNFYIVLVQDFGSGGSTAVEIPSSSVALTNSLLRYEVVFDVPSISGKIIGPGNNLGISIFFDQGSTYTTRTTNVMTNLGEQANYYHNKLLSQELLDCQRYYEKSYLLDIPPGSLTKVGAAGLRHGGDNAAVYYQPLKFVPKRVAPTISLYSTDDGAIDKWLNGGTGSNVDVSISSNGISNNSAEVEIAAGIANAHIYGHWTAESEL